MGSFKVRNLLLSKQLKRSESRILIIDDNQIRYNDIVKILQANHHLVHTALLDDLKSFEKQLNMTWDVIIFGRAYDIRIEQVSMLIQASDNIDIPILLLTPNNYQDEEYLSYIQKGIYDVVNLNHQDQFYISLMRGLSYSRTLQIEKNLANDLENVRLKRIEQVEEQNKAVAVIQEGIHVSANAEYLKLFGLKDESEIIGLPLLDVIQPNHLNDFKTRFKKVSQGQFEHGHFDVTTQNSHASQNNPLDVEFIAGEDDDAIQITIATTSSAPIQSQTHPIKTRGLAVVEKIQRFTQNHPSKENAIILFSLSSCPNDILSSDWDTFKGYFEKLSEFIKAQTQSTVFKIETALYATVLQAESIEILNSRLKGLAALEKPQLIRLGDHNYQQNIKIGYSIFDNTKLNENDFGQLIADAYNTPLPKNSIHQDIEFDIPNLETPPPSPVKAQPLELTLETIPNEIRFEPKSPAQELIDPTPIKEQAQFDSSHLIFKDSALLSQIQQSLERNEIQLKYQQLYDKNDSNVNTYEVTSGFIYENELKEIASLSELSADQELSIKVDRWILVEASKQLHNFITQYPEAKLIVNLNRNVLLHDAQFPALVSKLLTIVGSKLSSPLILQFDEEDIANNMIEANKAIQQLRDNGAEISVRHFGASIASDAILKQTDIALVTLDAKLCAMLNNDKKLPELQNLINGYIESKSVEILLKGLDDMGSFANAWNVEARFLQGDYFQKKLDHLTDVQDQ